MRNKRHYLWPLVGLAAMTMMGQDDCSTDTDEGDKQNTTKQETSKQETGQGKAPSDSQSDICRNLAQSVERLTSPRQAPSGTTTCASCITSSGPALSKLRMLA